MSECRAAKSLRIQSADAEVCFRFAAKETEVFSQEFFATKSEIRSEYKTCICRMTQRVSAVV